MFIQVPFNEAIMLCTWFLKLLTSLIKMNSVTVISFSYTSSTYTAFLVKAVQSPGTQLCLRVGLEFSTFLLQFTNKNFAAEMTWGTLIVQSFVSTNGNKTFSKLHLRIYATLRLALWSYDKFTMIKRYYETMYAGLKGDWLYTVRWTPGIMKWFDIEVTAVWNNLLHGAHVQEKRVSIRGLQG